eukprot:COSAG01_NODE_76_length_28332_cov_298.876992_21_plen_200_part_00
MTGAKQPTRQQATMHPYYLVLLLALPHPALSALDDGEPHDSTLGGLDAVPPSGGMVLQSKPPSLPQSPSPPPSPLGQTVECDLALEAICEEAREQGDVQCLLCAGAHQATLQRANCSNAALQAFCGNTSCIAKLASSCGGHNMDSSSCFDCVQCARAHSATTGCTLEDTTQFCDATAPPPPVSPRLRRDAYSSLQHDAG